MPSTWDIGKSFAPGRELLEHDIAALELLPIYEQRQKFDDSFGRNANLGVQRLCIFEFGRNDNVRWWNVYAQLGKPRTQPLFGG
jgi:hypothetical protein